MNVWNLSEISSESFWSVRIFTESLEFYSNPWNLVRILEIPPGSLETFQNIRNYIGIFEI